MQGPEEAEAGAEGSHGQLADIVAGDLDQLLVRLALFCPQRVTPVIRGVLES